MKAQIVAAREVTDDDVFIAIVSVTTKSDMQKEDVFKEIKAAVTKWASQTRNGKAAFCHAGETMNFGDLWFYPGDEIASFSDEILELKIEVVSPDVFLSYDTPVINPKGE